VDKANDLLYGSPDVEFGFWDDWTGASTVAALETNIEIKFVNEV